MNILELNDRIDNLSSKLKELAKSTEDSNALESLLKRFEQKINSFYLGITQRNEYLFNEKIQEYERKIVNLLVEVGKKRGDTAVFSSIVVYLLIHKDGLTQQQLKELTGFSIGSISTTLASMDETGVIKKSLIKGLRTYLYSLGENLGPIASNIKYVKIEVNRKTMEFIRSKIEELNNLPEQNKNGSKLLLNRINELIKFLKVREQIIEKIVSEFPFEQFS